MGMNYQIYKVQKKFIRKELTWKKVSESITVHIASPQSLIEKLSWNNIIKPCRVVVEVVGAVFFFFKI